MIISHPLDKGNAASGNKIASHLVYVEFGSAPNKEKNGVLESVNWLEMKI